MAEIMHNDETRGPSTEEQDAIRAIAEPFHGYTEEGLRAFAGNFLRTAGLGDELLGTFEKGALLAQQPGLFQVQDLQLGKDEMRALIAEKEHKWRISRTLFSLVVVCSMSAAVQGMDETAVNGGK